MQSLSLRKQAIKYRKQGYSYGMISKELNLSKSTLSDWLREIPYEPSKEVINRIGLARLKSAEFKRKQRMDDIFKMRALAKKEIGVLTKRDLWLLGIGIYLGEGSKLYEDVRVINSDPEIIKIIIKWFREIGGLSNQNFAPRVYIYPDNDMEETIDYWAKTTGIPMSQFMKTQIDKRKNKSGKKKRKLPYGTLHLQIRSCGKKEFGRSFHRRIMGWIEASIDQINNAGVV